MALPGFELLFRQSSQNLTNADAACVLVVHWNLISHGFRCCGVGESWPTEQQQSGNITASESLPEGWSRDPTTYALRYVDPSSNRAFLLKAVSLDGQLNIHLVRCFDEKAASVSVRPRDFVNDNLSTAASAFSNLAELNKKLTDDLVNKVVRVVGVGVQGGATGQRSASAPHVQGPSPHPRNPYQGPSPLLVDPSRGPGAMPPSFMPTPRPPFGGSVSDPYGVGRSDLDPFAPRGGGGMIMDPRGFPSPPRPGFPGGHPGAPIPGVPGGLPPGAVPPGARFDPMGPHMGGRAGPDPDNEAPPDGADDMFM